MLDRGGSPAGVVETLVRYEGGGTVGVVEGPWEKLMPFPLPLGVAGDPPNLKLKPDAILACVARWCAGEVKVLRERRRASRAVGSFQLYWRLERSSRVGHVQALRPHFYIHM